MIVVAHPLVVHVKEQVRKGIRIMEYKVTLIVKSDLWPDEIKAEVEEAIENECSSIEILGCFVDED